MRAQTALVLLLLVLPMPALAQTSADVRVGLAAEAIEDGVRVEVSAEGADLDLALLAHHRDPVAGRVVDRVVPLEVKAQTTVAVELRDLKPGANLTVELHRQHPKGEPKARTLLEAWPLTQTQVQVPLFNDTRPHVLAGYPIVRDVNASQGGGPFWLVATPDGDLVASWSNDGGSVGSSRHQVLHVSVSHDGGHTWDPGVPISDRLINGLSRPSWARGADGLITVVYGEWTATEAGHLVEDGPTRFARFDPQSARVVARGELPGLRLTGRSAMAPLAGGDLLLATVGDRQMDGRQTHPHLALWRLAADGTIDLLQRLPQATVDAYNSPVDITVAPDGQTTLLWLAPDPIPLWAPWAARAPSPEGPFGEPFRLDVPGRRTTGLTELRAHVDDLGTVHFVLATLNGDLYDWGEASTLYLRLPPNVQVPLVVPVNGNEPGALVPESHRGTQALLGADRGRVWILLANLIPIDEPHGQLETWAVESVAHGAAFGRPFRTHNVHGWPMLAMDALALTPEGRPILVGNYYHGHQELYPSVIPFFDPDPPADSGLVTRAVRSGVLPKTVQVVTPPPDPSDAAPGVPAPWAAAALLALAAGAWAARRRDA